MGKNETGNQDISPGEVTRNEMRGTYPHAAPLLTNSVMAEGFQGHEDLALNQKHFFERLSIGALIAIGGAVIYSYAQIRLDLVATAPGWLNTLVLVLGSAGLIVEFVIWRLGSKKKWLRNRFAAEYIRSLKFQCFYVACSVDNVGHLATATDKVSTAYLKFLEAKLQAPDPLSVFDARRALQLNAQDFVDGSETGDAIFREAVAAYRLWRIGYQKSFADSQIRKLRPSILLFKSLSEGLLFVGTIVALAEIAFSVFPALSTLPIATFPLDLVSVTLFVISAISYVIENGTARKQNSDRYEQYSRDLTGLLERDVTTREEFIALITEAEQVILRELEDFCRDASRISYRL